MNAGPDVERRISAWLADEVPTRAPDRLLPVTFERTRHTHQRRFGAAWRAITMNRTWQLATAAAASVLIVGLGAFWLGRSGGNGVIGGPQPSSAPTPSPTPRPSPYPTAGAVAPGRYVLAFPNTPSITFTVPAGWGFGGGGGPTKNEGSTRAMALSSWLVANVYGDPCQWGDGFMQPPVGPSVDDLANALARQPLRSGTPPTAVTVAGYTGKYLELTTPWDLDPSRCSKLPGAGATAPGFFVTWVDPDGGYMGFAGPGSRDRVWILDVRGERFVLAASEFRDATAQDRSELQSIIDSIGIEPLEATPSSSASSSP
jgi:hypothetical protein